MYDDTTIWEHELNIDYIDWVQEHCESEVNMFGYSQAAQEYERHLNCPYDKGGALYDYEEDLKEYENRQDDIANMQYDYLKENS